MKIIITSDSMIKRVLYAVKQTPEFTKLSWNYVVTKKFKSKVEFFSGYCGAWVRFFGFIEC